MEPTLKVGSKRPATDSSFDERMCIICQTFVKSKKLSVLGEDGCDKLLQAASERWERRDYGNIDVIDRLRLVDLKQLTQEKRVKYHRPCYSSFTSAFHIAKLKGSTESYTDTSEEASTSYETRSSRRSLPPLDKSLCIFCQQATREDLSQILTLPKSEKIMSLAKFDLQMRVRLAAMHDLVAEDCLYHPTCEKRFYRRFEKHRESEDVSPHELCLEKIAFELRLGFENLEIYTLQAVWERYTDLLLAIGETSGSYRDNRRRFKAALETQMPGELQFIPQLNPREPLLIFPLKSSGEIVQLLKKSVDEPSESHESESVLNKTATHVSESQYMLYMYHVAQKIRQEILSSNSYNNCLGINTENAASCIPKSLYVFLRLLCTGKDPTEHEDDDESVRRCVLSIAQDMMFGVSKGKLLTPKHIGLGLSVHQATRSKELVNLLNAAGHSVSYDMIRRIDTSIAKKVIDDIERNEYVPVPTNINRNTFFQFAADNIDILEETLDGKDTFHATQMVVFQRTQYETTDSCEIPIGKDKSITVPSELNELLDTPKITGRPSPKYDHPVQSQWFDPDRGLDQEADYKDVSWLLARNNSSGSQKLPAWTGFNSIVSRVESDKTKVGLLPLVNAPAHESDTMWTVINRCLKISEKLNPGQSTVLTLDQQLYSKAKELQWCRPDECKSLLVRLGSFHTALNFMRVIGQHFTDSGLLEVWTESGVYGENTASNIIAAKSYNKAMRAHKLTYEAVWRIYQKLFQDWLHQKEVDTETIDQSLSVLVTGFQEQKETGELSQMFDDVVDALKQKQILCLIEDFDKENQNPTFVYWRQYMRLVQILLRFIRAEREGNWNLHLSSFAAMLPWFAVYDHTNYTRWGTIYLADMKNIEETHPDIFAEFVNGNFVVKKTGHSFNQISTDQALEHVNKICKVAGGLIGITRLESARERWCLTFNQRSDIAQQTMDMYGLQSDDIGKKQKSKDIGASRIRRDEEDVKLIEQQLKRFHLFSIDQQDLVAIASRDVAPEELGNALLNAESRGKDKIKLFVDKRLKSHEVGFHDAILKSKSPTLKSMYESKKTAATGKAKVMKADRILFQRLFVAKSSGRTVDLPRILRHELFPVPLSLADTAGELHHTQKSALGQILEAGISVETLPASDVNTCTILDGQALVQATGKPKSANTFGDLARIFSSTCLSYMRKPCTRVDVVFDRYEKDSIKAGTRSFRKGVGSKRPVRRIVNDKEVPLPNNWKQFIDLEENKADLARLLSEELCCQVADGDIVTAGGFESPETVKCSPDRDPGILSATHEEADTRILLHAKDALLHGFERVVVVCRDTDVLVLLLHFKHQLPREIWFMSGTKKDPKYVPVHEMKLDAALRSVLPAFHALTGCDTVSQFAGHGKVTAWKAFENNSQLLASLGCGQLTHDTLDSVEKFVCKIYDPSTEITKIDQMRVFLFNKGKDPDSLPPTSDALKLHISRAHYQTTIWLNATVPSPERIDPETCGWERDPYSNQLKPKLLLLEPIPKVCTELLQCSCKVCATTRCKCRSNNLKCLPSCGCGSITCANPLNVVEDSDTEDEL